MNNAHEAVNRTGRMLFASKLLECAFNIELEFFYIHNALIDILNNEPKRGKDPLIYYATLPKVLGYWLIQDEDIGYECVQGTIYAPVEEYY